MGSVPEQVRRNAERAEQILNDINKAPADPDAAPPGTDQAPADAPEVAPAPVDTPAQVEQPAAPETPDQPPADAAPAPAPAKHEPTPEEKWEQRYRSLQGVLTAEQRRWSQERATFEERVRALEAASKPAAPAQPAAPDAKSLITDQDLETYGPELLDVIGRKANEIAAKIVKEQVEALKPQLEKTQAQVTDVSSQVYRNEQERFQGELAKAVPDWQTVNVDERWLQWLGEVDPLSGVPRQAYLDNAAQNLDHVRTARLFNAFKQTIGTPEPAPAAPAPATPAAQPTGKPAVSPSPRTVGTAVSPTPREPDTSVTTDEINAHYRRSSTDPAYRTSPEHAQMEKRIATAMAAGKITR